MGIPEIDIERAQQPLEEGAATFVDVRDPHALKSLHVPGAVPLDDSTVQAFLETADRQAPVVVHCYHGHPSLGATAYLQERGFREVFSLTGGFTAWREAGAPAEHGVPGQPATD